MDPADPFLETAWFAVRDVLPPRWQVGRASVWDPARETRSVSAIGQGPGRGKLRTVVTGTGDSEIEALRSAMRRYPGP